MKMFLGSLWIRMPNVLVGLCILTSTLTSYPSSGVTVAVNSRPRYPPPSIDTSSTDTNLPTPSTDPTTSGTSPLVIFPASSSNASSSTTLTNPTTSSNSSSSSSSTNSSSPTSSESSKPPTPGSGNQTGPPNNTPSSQNSQKSSRLAGLKPEVMMGVVIAICFAGLFMLLGLFFIYTRCLRPRLIAKKEEKKKAAGPSESEKISESAVV
ncbi:hypothetical protein PSTT_14923 [Puccinia striiformis]|uniref:Mid2 domain-containing protein n=1 Tax=Puccinia striiformis TaxID=27350 RepID=A0A2S4UKB5_9BASI|nr:hypothetical protein PSTT_14923 [Puccinia striiformis]